MAVRTLVMRGMSEVSAASENTEKQPTGRDRSIAALKKHQFRKGQSGNPGGRGKGRTFTEHLNAILAEKTAPRARETQLEALARKLVNDAKRGNYRAIEQILARVSPPLTRVKDETPPKQIVMVMQPEDPPEGWDPLKALQEGEAPALPAVVDVDGTTDSDNANTG